MKDDREITQSTKVASIFTYFGENRDDLLTDKEITAEAVFIQKKDSETELTQEDIMLRGTKMKLEHYDSVTGIIKLGFEPKLPLWVFNNFAGYFIPVFEL
jgi:hypothetical protein